MECKLDYTDAQTVEYCKPVEIVLNGRCILKPEDDTGLAFLLSFDNATNCPHLL